MWADLIFNLASYDCQPTFVHADLFQSARKLPQNRKIKGSIKDQSRVKTEELAMTAPIKPTYEQLAAALANTRRLLFAAEKVIRNQRLELARCKAKLAKGKDKADE